MTQPVAVSIPASAKLGAAVATVEEARAAAATVDGWLEPHEGPLLFELARACRGDGAIIEIGSWKGKSTIWLALGARASGTPTQIAAVDPHTGSEEHQRAGELVWTFDEFRENIRRAGVSDRVVPIVQASVEAAADFEGPVELLWVDGAHDYESVKADVAAWAPKLIEGGVIAFHDSKWPGVRRAIEEEIYCGETWRDIRRVEGITWARKASNTTVADRVTNRARMWIRRTYDAAYARRGLIPTPVRTLAKGVLRRLDADATA